MEEVIRNKALEFLVAVQHALDDFGRPDLFQHLQASLMRFNRNEISEADLTRLVVGMLGDFPHLLAMFRDLLAAPGPGPAPVAAAPAHSVPIAYMPSDTQAYYGAAGLYGPGYPASLTGHSVAPAASYYQPSPRSYPSHVNPLPTQHSVPYRPPSTASAAPPSQSRQPSVPATGPGHSTSTKLTSKPSKPVVPLLSVSAAEAKKAVKPEATKQPPKPTVVKQPSFDDKKMPPPPIHVPTPQSAMKSDVGGASAVVATVPRSVVPKPQQAAENIAIPTSSSTPVPSPSPTPTPKPAQSTGVSAPAGRRPVFRKPVNIEAPPFVPPVIMPAFNEPPSIPPGTVPPKLCLYQLPEGEGLRESLDVQFRMTPPLMDHSGSNLSTCEGMRELYDRVSSSGRSVKDGVHELLAALTPAVQRQKDSIMAHNRQLIQRYLKSYNDVRQSVAVSISPPRLKTGPSSSLPRGLSQQALARHPPMRHLPRVVHTVITTFVSTADMKVIESKRVRMSDPAPASAGSDDAVLGLPAISPCILLSDTLLESRNGGPLSQLQGREPDDPISDPWGFQIADIVKEWMNESFVKPPVKDRGTLPSLLPEDTRNTVTLGLKIRPCVLPLVCPLPKTTSWVGLRFNHFAEDDAVLRFVPYFGEDDQVGVDLSAYSKIHRGRVHQSLDNETVEQVITAIIQAKGADPAVFEALAPLFRPSDVNDRPDIIADEESGWKPPVTLQFVDAPKRPTHPPVPTPDGETPAHSPFGNLDMVEAMKELDGEDVKRKWEEMSALRSHLSSHAWMAAQAKESEYLRELYSSSPACSSSTVVSSLYCPSFLFVSNLASFGSACLGLRARDIPRPGLLENATEIVTDNPKDWVEPSTGDGELDASARRKHRISAFKSLAESFRELYCRRCCVYDCRRHGTQHPIPRDKQLSTTMTITPDLTLDPVAISVPHCSRSCYKQPFRFTVSAREPTFNTLEMRLLFKIWGVVEWKQRSVVTKYANHASFVSNIASSADVGGDLSNVTSPFTESAGAKAVSPDLWPCLVAKFMGTRTCRDVWWFRQSVPDVLFNGDARCLCPRQGLDPPGPRCGYCLFMEAVLDSFVVAPREFVCRAHAALETSGNATVGAPDAVEDVGNPAEGVGDGENGVALAPEPVPGGKRARKVDRVKDLRKFIESKMFDKSQSREFIPCNHDGPCTAENCNCVVRGKLCERYCACPPTCLHKFPGCRCKKSSCYGNSCPCVKAMRECDPDVCICAADCTMHTIWRGGVHMRSLVAAANCNTLGPHLHTHGKPPELSVTDPEVGPSETKRARLSPAADGVVFTDCALDSNKMRPCLNVTGQTMAHKRLVVGRSGIHGWGAYTLEAVEKNEFIYEYTGELISQDEADRRGRIYDKLHCSFLFNLDDEWVVDATRKGSKIKFANHSLQPNCYAKIIQVNGDHKIGIYAGRNIEPGEELSFNYRYGEEHGQGWSRKG